MVSVVDVHCGVRGVPFGIDQRFALHGSVAEKISAAGALSVFADCSGELLSASGLVNTRSVRRSAKITPSS